MLFGLASVWALGWLVPACGSRTGLFPGGADGGVQSCRSSADCEQTDPCVVMGCVDTFCQATGTVECPSTDPCLVGACELETGGCVYVPVTEDRDGDGFLAALPGTISGTPGSCGDDCDDTSPLAHPGGVETCDGVDNDCDGIVDNGIEYLSDTVPEQGGLSPRPVTGADMTPSGANDLTFGAGTFLVGYSIGINPKRAHIHGISETGEDVFSSAISDINAAALDIEVAFSGDSFGVMTADNRMDGNYELYFDLFDAVGQKLGHQRVTQAPQHSVGPRLLFDQGRFVVVWEDRRAGQQLPQVFAQILGGAGELLGDNILLSPPAQPEQYPYLAATAERFGMVSTAPVDPLNPIAMRIVLRTFDKSFADATPPLEVAAGDAYGPGAVVTAVGDRFLVTWELRRADGFPGAVIRGALFDQWGQPLVSARNLTSGATLARTHAVLSLGDRVLLVWADDADDLGGAELNYELYAKVLSLELEELEPRTRLTSDAAETVRPALALSDGGRVGILFDDKRSGAFRAYFMTLGCR